ncbi:acetate and sugar kinases/Hsc70/actin family protein [Thiorhodovibrio frisius]|nr:hypothetical protein [Thiorhodovibrio frisius]
MSVVIETAAGLIGADGSGQPPVAVIERALAEGRMSILYQGRRVDLLPALQQASTGTARIALEELRQDLRREQTAVDRILVTGGGSAWFMPLVSDLFEPVPVEIPRDPVTANARGYFVYGGR